MIDRPPKGGRGDRVSDQCPTTNRFGAFDSIIQKVNTICRRFRAEHKGAESTVDRVL